MVHSHYWLSGLVGERLKKTWDVPHVTMFHTLGEIKNRSSLQEHETDLRIELGPGEYAFYCTVDAHRASGMEGTLTVR